MFTPGSPLPAEVWTLVFRLLSHSDRLRVRATCRHFRDLVDDSGLFRDWAVELRRGPDEHEGHFWSTLRRWRVSSALLSCPRRWKRIAAELPGLTALTVNSCCAALRDLRSFTNVERLHIILQKSVRFEELSRCLPPRITHFRVCHFTESESIALPPDIHPKSHFKKLRSLVLHCEFAFYPVTVLHFFIWSLPQLQHLSLKLLTATYVERDMSELPPLHGCSLCSLELVDCKPINLPLDFMRILRTLPSLRSLAIFCRYYKYNLYDEDESLKLSTWLRDLPALSSLGVKCMVVGGFVRSIPSSVTRLTLLPGSIDSEEMASLSERLPGLRHLHLDPRRPRLGPDTALVPRLFPKLKTLRLRHEEVPEDAFLSLASLEELQVLETLDAEAPPTALVSKLRALTSNRVQIHRRREELWQHSCRCSAFIPTQHWATDQATDQA